ncbi:MULTISPECIES: hydrogenase nickel incorporation protein HypB [unclassified Pseudofrankia]|uniref:hydrogenase nickel incorporation protein HypB n=1 Tax=unclassified Pseudofrankia TaxID=2994372 RepID=UPI0008DA1CD6|nr:hydrogenase nickel incorporation protein HypB [Pseudofrankia sp. BMG5.36]OHV56462.1 hydrogenase accessory protein HypB [Pseudofrankia sp. BMG5.36]
MCVTCGCDGDARPRIVGPVDPVRRGDDPVRRDKDERDPARADGRHAGHPGPGDRPAIVPSGRGLAGAQLVTLEERVLAKNDAIAASNRHWLAHQGILAVNVMSSPGAGKTTLLERTIRALNAEWPIAVVEGDQEGVLDADRIRASGAPVVQVNTGDGCHLDAEMFDRGLRTLPLAPGTLVFVENVGNLVCPALFDLGEGARVVVTAVTEGEDKPAKYPRMFASADLVLINKCDLLPHVDFDAAACERHIRLASPRAEVMVLSARTGEGLSAWYGWLRHRRGHREAEISACSTHHHHPHPPTDPTDSLSASAPVESSAP